MDNQPKAAWLHGEMKRFILQTCLFLLAALLVGEIIVRAFSLIDVPRLYKGTDKLIHFYPNQKGTFKNALRPVWEINEYGYCGKAPESFDNLIVLYGDSFIENLMNPVSCHQNAFLKTSLPKYNYLEAARSSATLLEMLEKARNMDTLRPILEVLYVKDDDFLQSIDAPGATEEFVRLDLKNHKLLYSVYRESFFKDILHNCKFPYYMYRSLWLSRAAAHAKQNHEQEKGFPELEIIQLLEFLKTNYDLQKKIFVFFPNTDKRIVNMCIKAGFNTFMLKGDQDKSWQFENDPHWNCHGHEEAAKQVKVFIEQSLPK